MIKGKNTNTIKEELDSEYLENTSLKEGRFIQGKRVFLVHVKSLEQQFISPRDESLF